MVSTMLPADVSSNLLDQVLQYLEETNASDTTSVYSKTGLPVPMSSPLYRLFDIVRYSLKSLDFRQGECSDYPTGAIPSVLIPSYPNEDSEVSASMIMRSAKVATSDIKTTLLDIASQIPDIQVSNRSTSSQILETIIATKNIGITSFISLPDSRVRTNTSFLYFISIYFFLEVKYNRMTDLALAQLHLEVQQYLKDRTEKTKEQRQLRSLVKLFISSYNGSTETDPVVSLTSHINSLLSQGPPSSTSISLEKLLQVSILSYSLRNTIADTNKDVNFREDIINSELAEVITRCVFEQPNKVHRHTNNGNHLVTPLALPTIATRY
jgi:hypothetical protein